MITDPRMAEAIATVAFQVRHNKDPLSREQIIRKWRLGTDRAQAALEAGISQGTRPMREAIHNIPPTGHELREWRR